MTVGHKRTKADESGNPKRRMTLYFPSDLAKALAHRCVDLDRDVSDAVTEAVQLWLRGAK